MIFSALFLRYIATGGSYLPGETAFNEYVSQLIIAVIIYFAGCSKFIKDYLSKKSAKKEIPAAPVPAPAASTAAPATDDADETGKDGDGK